MNGLPSPGRLALYARVSSERQARQATIASQVDAVTERITRDGLALPAGHCFVDEGYSGASLVRPALERLRDLAACGGLDRLYVLAPDRLARTPVDQAVLVDELNRCGVEIIFLNRPIGQSPEDQLLLHIQGVVAEYERAKILERSRRGRRHAARCGHVSVLSQAPYGYHYLPQAPGVPARYEVVPEEARVVQQIFTWVGRERLPLHGVCRRLDAQGVPTRTGQPRWSRRSVWGMLQNPAYRGQAEYGKTRSEPRRPGRRPARGRPEVPRWPRAVRATAAEERIAIAVPALVDDGLFALVQEQLAENRRRARQARAGASYLLQGLTVCTGCGYAVCAHRVWSPGRGGRPGRWYVYYRCAGTSAAHHGGQAVCRQRALGAEALEAAVWQDVCGLLADPGRLAREYERRVAETRPGGTAAEAWGRQRRRCEQGLARLIDAYAEGLLDKQEFEPRVRSLKDRLGRLAAEERQAAAQAEQATALREVVGRFQDFAESVTAGLAGADAGTRREVIRALVKRIEVDTEEVRLVYRVNLHPFVDRPGGGVLQDCLGRPHSPFGQDRPTPCKRRFFAAGSRTPPQLAPVSACPPGVPGLVCNDMDGSGWRRFGRPEPSRPPGRDPDDDFQPRVEPRRRCAQPAGQCNLTPQGVAVGARADTATASLRAVGN